MGGGGSGGRGKGGSSTPQTMSISAIRQPEMLAFGLEGSSAGPGFPLVASDGEAGLPDVKLGCRASRAR